MRRFVVVGLTLGLIAICSSVDGRIWTDSSGKHSIDAELIEFIDGQVRLKKANGEIARLPLGQLSKKDQKYVQVATKTKRGNPCVLD